MDEKNQEINTLESTIFTANEETPKKPKKKISGFKILIILLALLVALGKDVIVEDGKLKEAFKANLIENIKTEQNTYATTIEIDIANIDELNYKIKDVVLFNADYETEEYFEESILSNCTILENLEEGKITITMNHDQALVNKYIGKMGIDIYYEVYQNETLYEEGYKSLYSVFS